jgi:dTDP-L-rhamnose 4-epimerase
MARQILITGGAGFIGSHLADLLLARGHRVRILDNLSAEVHGPDAEPPVYLNPDAELVRGDVRDPEAVGRALRGVDAVFHLAALVGVGQSMDAVARYTATNDVGTAVLLEGFTRHPVERLVLASSMSLYGEGLYRTGRGMVMPGEERPLAQLRAGLWELSDLDGEPFTPLPTPETKPPSLASVYALNKFIQEQLCLMLGRAYGISAVVLRFFNVYGPRQALSNPCSGVLASFAGQLLHRRPPVVFEDGLQRRDFVHVADAAEACRLALEVSEAANGVFNVGSGHSYTVLEVAHRLARVLGREEIEPAVTGTYRAGDIRHCFADIGRARTVLGFQPRVMLEAGLADLAAWLECQAADDWPAGADPALATTGRRYSGTRRWYA